MSKNLHFLYMFSFRVKKSMFSLHVGDAVPPHRAAVAAFAVVDGSERPYLIVERVAEWTLVKVALHNHISFLFDEV